ncbi:bifunctional 3-phenylpropionate/cinnamic acid dioxygenase ferredoxin subunit [Amycolatopsis sp. GM8]|uniref:bifunctional 3-phenylpropionate/cinnamic acid dioxygenase ferredoxin subunit n=1 Tax=Amycolatopsis sp. GM8 TaxID=2896530 RepID=UPI001F01233C|nr:bifunctional 3-phenylpropionate/cinnamic acid dioxygenase ferredoxin subunit [Amycolatopsis sp. GM8]
MAWLRACGRDEIDDGEAARIETDPPVAVFNVDGEFYATADTCTHDESSLADGYVDGDRVECPWHFAKFCIRTGAVLSLPATAGLTTYPVKVAGDDIMVDMPD